MESGKQPRVLVIRGGAIGDFILTLPVIRLLKQSLPGAAVEVLGSPGIADLAMKAGLAENCRSLSDPGLALLFARGATLSSEWQAYFRSFHLVISYLFDPEGLLKQNLERAGVQTLLQGSPKLIAGQGHATEQLARPLEKIALFLNDTDWRQPLFPHIGSSPRILRIAIHPGSGSVTKNWPAEHWLRLTRDIAARHPEAEMALVLGEAEAERRSIPDDVMLQRWDRIPLPALVDHLSGCDLFLGHDSGISHLASTCGVPCVLLFGPTDPSTWAPPQHGHQILRAPAGDLTCLSYEVVRDEVMKAVDALHHLRSASLQ